MYGWVWYGTVRTRPRTHQSMLAQVEPSRARWLAPSWLLVFASAGAPQIETREKREKRETSRRRRVPFPKPPSACPVPPSRSSSTALDWAWLGFACRFSLPLLGAVSSSPLTSPHLNLTSSFSFSSSCSLIRQSSPSIDPPFVGAGRSNNCRRLPRFAAVDNPIRCDRRPLDLTRFNIPDAQPIGISVQVAQAACLLSLSTPLQSVSARRTDSEASCLSHQRVPVSRHPRPKALGFPSFRSRPTTATPLTP